MRGRAADDAAFRCVVRSMERRPVARVFSLPHPPKSLQAAVAEQGIGARHADAEGLAAFGRIDIVGQHIQRADDLRYPRRSRPALSSVTGPSGAVLPRGVAPYRQRAIQQCQKSEVAQPGSASAKLTPIWLNFTIRLMPGVGTSLASHARGCGDRHGRP